MANRNKRFNGSTVPGKIVKLSGYVEHVKSTGATSIKLGDMQEYYRSA